MTSSQPTAGPPGAAVEGCRLVCWTWDGQSFGGGLLVLSLVWRCGCIVTERLGVGDDDNLQRVDDRNRRELNVASNIS
jgi:hypothetical protein